MPITTSSYTTPVEQNRVSIAKFGNTPDIDTGSIPEDVWDIGGLYPWPTSALETTVVSDSANDNAAGTGAQSVSVQGLDANWNFIRQEIALNGLTPVTLPTNLIRCFRANIEDAGSGGINAGNIQILHAPTAIAQITVGQGQTLMAIYTVPLNYGTMRLSRWWGSIGKQAAAFGEIDIFFRFFGKGWRSFKHMDLHSQGSSQFEHNFSLGVDILAPPRTDIRLTITEMSANNTDVSAGFDLQGNVTPRQKNNG